MHLLQEMCSKRRTIKESSLFTSCVKNFPGHGIDLSKVKGTGNEGRITRKDLLKLVESGNLPKADEPSAIPDSAPEETRSSSQSANQSSNKRSDCGW